MPAVSSLLPKAFENIDVNIEYSRNEKLGLL